MPYCMYLRKSRADIELEAQGEMETLARHEKILLELSNKLDLTVTKIFKEIVSGENIAERPEVQKLLSEVEDGLWEGVLVVEIERLARGDTIDQGIVARAFKYGNAKIITPNKIYDPDNEFDEEYFEFGLFMSRREYKTISRRIQRGRIEAVKEGKFIASTPPYGYNKVKVNAGKGYTLIPNNEADIVRKIFELYLAGNGMTSICEILDNMNIKPRNSDTWSKSTISDILKNPVYTGVIRWSYRPEKKSKDNTKLRYKNDNCIITKGLHEPIITEETFQKAQNLLKANNRIPVKSNLELKNPLTGLGYCSKCGTKLTRLGASTKNTVDKIMCPNKKCSTVSAPINLVEKNIIIKLKELYKKYEVELKQENIKNDISFSKKALTNLEKEIEKVNKQVAKTYDLLEQEVYTVDIFKERIRALVNLKNELENKLELLKDSIALDYENEHKNKTYKKVISLIDAYCKTKSIEGKNKILRLLIFKFEYSKNERNTKGNLYNENISIKIYPLLPIS